VVGAVAALGGSYRLGLGRWRRAGRSWPRARTACYAAGVVSIALVGLAFLGVYDDVLFWTRAVQNIVLLMVTSMLLALGSPIRLMAELLPVGARAPLARALHSRAARALTFPLVATLGLVVPITVLYLSPLYADTLTSGVASAAAGVVLTATGFVYFWTRFRIDPTPRRDPYGITLVLTVVEMIGDAVLGMVLWFGPLVAAAFYAGLARDWGPSVRMDQIVGAGVLWIGGDLVGLPFIGIVFVRMMREDERRGADVDRALDAAEAARRTSTPSEAPTAAETTGLAAAAEPERPRLWWEDDPELSQRFRRR
jgi:cytochrome c oxidase assembly factor CtaG